MTNTMPKNYAETILNDKNLTSDEKFQRINFVYNNYQEKLDEDLQNFLLKKWAGAALEIGSAAIPFGGTGKLGATAGQKLLQKTIGRKLSQEIGSGTASGLVSGAVFGTGRGLIEDKNPLITGLQDATGGLAAGALIGGTGGYLEKSVRANLLENAKPLSELSQTQIKNLIKQGKNYYQDYLHDTHVYYPPLDKIYFRNSQAGEIRPHNMKMVPKIPEQIRTSYGLKHSNDKPWRQDANNFYKLYNTHKGKTYEYIIRNNANKTGNDFYQIKEVDSAPAYLHHNQALETEPVNIINDNSGNINPVPMIIPPQVLQNLQDNNIPSFLLEGGVEMNVDTNGNQIFTPQEIGSGTASGLASGAVFGTGRDLIEDKNPLITGLQDAGLGIILDTLKGNIAGQAERFVRGQSLKNYGDIDLLPKDIRKQYTQDVKDFYKDYIQEIILDRNGSINFSKRGVQEQLRWNPKQGQNYPELIKDIKNAKRLPNVPNLKPHQKPLVNHYELYQGKNGIHHVEVLKDGHQRYYITKDTFNGTPQATSPGSKEDILKDTHKSGSHATSTDALVSPYNIINDNSGNINPVPMIIPPQVLQNLQDNNIPSFLLEGGVEMNVDTNGNQIFTPQEIGEMTPDEFQENIQIIQQQLKNGLIKPQAHQVDYSGYVNPETGDRKIFSREAISQMTSDEYTGNESAIMAQLKSIGIPYESDLELAGMRSGGVVYVKPYTRSDGTEVRGHWRSAPAI